MAINDGRRQGNLDLTYPFGGVSETFAFSDQPSGTSRDERNMRCFDPGTGRARGTQRTGLDLFTGDSPANGFSKITSLTSVQRQINPLKWEVQANPIVEGTMAFAVTADGLANCIDLKRDLFETYWALCDGGEVLAISDDGSVTKRIETGIDEGNNLTARRLCVDDFGNVFVASGQEEDHTIGSNLDAYIKAYELQADGEYKLAWTLNPGFHPIDMVIYGEDLLVWGIYYSQDYNQSEWRFRRYAVYTFDAVPQSESNGELDVSYSSITANVGYGSNEANFVGGMRVAASGQVYVTSAVVISNEIRHAIRTSFQCIVPTQITATVTGYNSASATQAGLGIDVELSEVLSEEGKQVYWTIGGTRGTGNPHISVWEEDTLQASLSFGASATGFSVAPNSERMRISSDQNGNVYVPYHGNDANSDEDGNQLLVYKWTEGLSWSIDKLHTVAEDGLGVTRAAVLCAAVPVAIPSYDTTSVTYAHRVVTGGTPNTTVGSKASVSSVTLIEPYVSNELPLREIRNVATSDGKWYEYTTAGYQAVLDPDGLSISHRSDAPYVSSASGQGIIMYTDGSRGYVYDPATRTVDKWRSGSLGRVPQRQRLVAYWRGRAVLARSDESPGSWHMSRVNDPYDWDQFPPEPDVTAAISAVTSKAGQCPDIINSIVPYKDDLLWFGCDHSIYQLTGDPGSGGQFDLVSDEIGMSFGKPWCKDDTGTLWFFGSKGGLYTIAAGGGIVDVSANKMRRRLNSIDLESYYIEMFYNFIDDGVHILVMPFRNPGIIVDHYFFDKRTQSFHIDRFGRNTGDGIQPTSVLVVDGDSPLDRTIHIGCEDGRVRKWGAAESGEVPRADRVTTNSYLPIDSYVVMGPIAPNRDMDVTSVTALNVLLAPDYGGCHYEFFETDDAANLGDPLEAGDLQAGRNNSHMVRVSGDSIYLKMRNARELETWSYEKAQIFTSTAGTVRRK